MLDEGPLILYDANPGRNPEFNRSSMPLAIAVPSDLNDPYLEYWEKKYMVGITGGITLIHCSVHEFLAFIRQQQTMAL